MEIDRDLSVSDIQAMLDQSPFIQFSGIRCVSVDNVNLQVVMKQVMRPEMERIPESGQWHGGPIAALIDTAGDFALVLTVKSGVPTINFRTDYLKPAFTRVLIAKATVRRAGRTVGVVDVDVTDDAGQLLAVGRGTYSTKAG